MQPTSGRSQRVGQPNLTIFSSSKRPPMERPKAPHLVEPLEQRRLFAVFTVNSTADTVQADSALTLREAIEVINGTLTLGGAGGGGFTGGASALSSAEQAQVNLAVPLGQNDVIQFNIPGSGVQTIAPTTSLPALNRSVIIDGFSQPGSAKPTATSPATNLIRLDGSQDTDPVASGLILASDHDVIAGFVIDNFATYGLLLASGSTNSFLDANIIGLSPDGLSAQGNGVGVIANGSTGTLIGNLAGQRNVISGNRAGILLVANDDGMTITGNYIGTDGNGNAGNVGNTEDGIRVSNASNVTIGGAEAGDGNIISGNTNDGIKFDAHAAGNPLSDVVEGNYIGTDVSGSVAVPNGGYGIEVIGDNAGAGPATFLTIGGTTAGARNVIAGNALDEIDIHSFDAGDNVIEGNYIGLNAAGNGVLGNDGDGIDLEEGSDNTQIGGSVAAAANFIAGNTTNGIEVQNSSDNLIQGNRIGVLGDGITPAGNGADGITIEFDSDTNVIGGADSQQGNLIANNARQGVEVSSLDTNVPTADTIRFNSIYNNGQLGIDLDTFGSDDGITANDPGDTDAGANNLQNFPTLSAASATSNSVSVSGSLASTANSTYVIDFFANPVADPSGNGQGKQYIGSANVMTDATGGGSFNTTFNVAVGSNLYISATATVLTGTTFTDTSEFSPTIKAATPSNPTDPTNPTNPTNPTSPLPASLAPRLATLKATLTQLQSEARTQSQPAAIKRLLATATHQLTAAATLVKKQTADATLYTKDASLITALNAQLAAQSSASGKAKIQKKLSAAKASQAKALNLDNAVTASATSALNTVASEEATIQAELMS